MDDMTTQFDTLLKGIWKHRWTAVTVTWVVAVVGWVVVYQMPDKYESSARIYVDTSSVLKPLMTSMAITSNMKQQVSAISRTMINRPNVEKIADKVNFIDKNIGKKAREESIDKLMKDIVFESTIHDDLFTISYINTDKRIANEIVQSLLDIFVKGEHGVNADPSSAISFLDRQIKLYEKKLIEGENALKTFKQKNIGLMPQQGADYYTQVAKAGEDLRRAQFKLREAEYGRDSLKKQISGEIPIGGTLGANPTFIVNEKLDARIEDLSKKIDELRINFTEEHPDIISTNRLIESLQKRKIDEAQQLKSINNDDGDFIDERNYSPMLQTLNLELVKTEAKIVANRAVVKDFTDRYEKLKSQNNLLPQVEASLAQLNRDYDLNKKNYQKLIERREAVKISGELGSPASLLAFKVIDPPTVLQIGTVPTRSILNSIIFFGALLAGIGTAFTISQFRPSFHSRDELRRVTGMEILGTVPKIWTMKERLNRKNHFYAFGLSLLTLFGLYGTLMIKIS